MRRSKRQTAVHFAQHAERLKGRASDAEKIESLGFFEQLASDCLLPDNIDDKLLCAFITAARDKKHSLEVRKAGLRVLSKVLCRNRIKLTRQLLEQGVIGLLAETATDQHAELRSDSCTTDCLEALWQGEAGACTMQMLHDACCGASARDRVAVRAAVDVVHDLCGLMGPEVVRAWLKPSIARDLLLPSLAQALHLHGANDLRLAQNSLSVLVDLCAGEAELLWKQPLVVQFLLKTIAGDKKDLAVGALKLARVMLLKGTAVQCRALMESDNFILKVLEWGERSPDEVAINANSVLVAIGEKKATALIAADYICAKPERLVHVKSLLNRRFEVAEFIVSILDNSVSDGATVQSDSLITSGLLYDLIRIVTDRGANHNYPFRALKLRELIPKIIWAHPEYKYQLKMAGVEQFPLNIDIVLPPRQQGQQ